MGHRDTRLPQGRADRRPFKIEGDRAYGPGVADMKSRPRAETALCSPPSRNSAAAPGRRVVALFTGDEEIGSPFSRR